MMKNKKQLRLNATRMRRERRTREKIKGTASRPRLSVFRTAKHISAQIIDDATGKTLAAASSEAMEEKELAALEGKVAVAAAVGKLIAEAGKKAGVTAVVYDRGGFAYHGRVKALADAARENGLTF
jgi:large subunit ribosomal protein L18